MKKYDLIEIGLGNRARKFHKVSHHLFNTTKTSVKLEKLSGPNPLLRVQKNQKSHEYEQQKKYQCQFIKYKVTVR